MLLEQSEGNARAKSILYSRYGRPHVVAGSYINNLVYGPQYKASDTDGLLLLLVLAVRNDIFCKKN